MCVPTRRRRHRDDARTRDEGGGAVAGRGPPSTRLAMLTRASSSSKNFQPPPAHRHAHAAKPNARAFHCVGPRGERSSRSLRPWGAFRSSSPSPVSARPRRPQRAPRHPRACMHFPWPAGNFDAPAHRTHPRRTTGTGAWREHRDPETRTSQGVPPRGRRRRKKKRILREPGLKDRSGDQAGARGLGLDHGGGSGSGRRSGRGRGAACAQGQRGGGGDGELYGEQSKQAKRLRACPSSACVRAYPQSECPQGAKRGRTSESVD